ncbi:MAG TPA: hypothetical protein VL545_03760 [Rhodanobacter sp.]|jgi:hypothetical protein|nr:hypothetical protein [Rhodanobacter sp.]
MGVAGIAIGPALFQGDRAMRQLWFFRLMPITGGLIGGLICRYRWSDQATLPEISGDSA